MYVSLLNEATHLNHFISNSSFCVYNICVSTCVVALGYVTLHFSITQRVEHINFLS